MNCFNFFANYNCGSALCSDLAQVFAVPGTHGTAIARQQFNGIQPGTCSNPGKVTVNNNPNESKLWKFTKNATTCVGLFYCSFLQKKKKEQKWGWKYGDQVPLAAFGRIWTENDGGGGL